ncbi:thioredoxin family protein [uncultured Desulfuromonas sp.]|uniref:thioredoxin family protein n=1 Tax=uncultured Desulfuromonas sp. TaxID=181013 RepID=UPI002AAB1E46|nr:thioredoxin family protein [uncultured Desulfuromonas sp.]
MVTIQILGTGCHKCTELANNAEQAATKLGLEYSLEKITDLNQIVTFGCMTTPGLVINGQLVSQGKLLKAEQVQSLLKK